MKCALAAMGFLNENLSFNKDVILRTMAQYAAEADIILFGEAFLPGFYGATFDPSHDAQIAVTVDDPIIQEIRTAAKTHGVAVSFGLIEKEQDVFYSTQLTVDASGVIIDRFRRVSPGWKERYVGDAYREGTGFHIFSFMDRHIAVALCGDLWFDDNIRQINELHPEIVFWPVYTDYNHARWNKAIKHEYAIQAGHIDSKVLYVNSVCLDKEGDEIARGGAAVFCSGNILRELPAGQEGVLISEV